MGCLVFIKEHSRHQKDIFGLFDGIIISPTDGVVFIQIKTNSFGNIEKTRSFCEKYEINAEIIVFKNGEKLPHLRSFRIRRCNT